MSKKVLILSSSPRRGGNSDILCDQFLAGAQEVGHQVEKIFLKDKKISYCTGCGVCFEKHVCSQKDDMTEILNKMIVSDVIVMSTPVYFYTMCGQMKTLIDRTCARYAEVRNKEFYFIVTAAVKSKESLKRTIEEFRGFTSCLTKPKEKGAIYGTGSWNVGDIKQSKVMVEAYEMGKSV
jgi:multimeric flavodoxin WrbA